MVNGNRNLNTSIKEITGKKENLNVKYIETGNELSMDTNQVLLAVGRKGVVPQGMDQVGVKYSSNGIIEVDDTLQTNIPYIFATGDITGRTPYFHAAVRESIVAANNIMGDTTDKMDFVNVPVSIFTFPPVSYIGILRN